ncbi:AI-2E family transporter [Haliea sp. E1-2-M8]|uniref:AI-2E family transporter n=1 Tax=Haliea sp. E1-2-M8 TaxID=3064706 RepID=UPI002727C756|nr:AI-2E family transporter [Haliea sp. E1-2-M8]MDO8862274.1 AI-2E family transporter [Haliea sp. E1-2-M8]
MTNEQLPERAGAAAQKTESPEPPKSSLAFRSLLMLALLYTIYFAKSLLIPIVVALIFALLLSPLVQLLKRFYIPRAISAILILSLIGGPLILLATQLAEPAQRWAKAIPELTEQFSQRVDKITDSLTATPEPIPAPEPPKPRGFTFFGLFGDDSATEAEAETVNVEESAAKDENRVSEKIKQSGVEVILTMLSGAPWMIAQLLTTVMLILFLLVFGPGLFVSFVNTFPRIQDKRRSIVLVRTIQVELSRYIVTVSAINTCLGLATAGALWLFGVQDALLWGVLVGMLNFAPYVGPLLAVIVLLLAGVVQYGAVASAALPAMVYFSINLVEAQVVTPLIMGRNMRLNPLVIIVWLVAWGWLWGAMGVLLAMPLLVCLKLAIGQSKSLRHWVDAIESRGSDGMVVSGKHD